MSTSPEISREAILEVAQNAKEIAGKPVVIKIGGELIADNAQREHIAEDMEILTDLGVSPIIVHGGSPHIKEAFEDAGVKTTMKDGKRITPQEHVEIVASGLRKANEQLVSAINERNEGSVISYPDGVLIGRLSNNEDFGSVDPESVRISINQSPKIINLEEVSKAGKVAVVNCLGKLEADQAVELAAYGKIKTPNQGVPSINLNADIAGVAVAKILGAYKFVSLAAVGAVLDKNGQRIDRIHGEDHAKELILDETINAGMIPKVIEAIRLLPFVGSVAISSPKNLAHELLLDQGAGTLITKE